MKAWLKHLPVRNGVHLAGSSHAQAGIAQTYLRVREREGRVLSDATVAALPNVAERHPHHAEWRIRAQSAQALCAHLQPRKPRRVLELGCGNGWLSHLLAYTLATEVIALDINLPELEQGARVFASQPNLHFVQGDVFDRALTDALTGQFDAIIIASAIQYFADAAQLVQHLRGLLSPQGELHVFDSHLHAGAQTAAATQRTQTYYAALGEPAAAMHYHAHALADLLPLGARLLYNPRSLHARIAHRLLRRASSPFHWLVFTRQMPAPPSNQHARTLPDIQQSSSRPIENGPQVGLATPTWRRLMHLALACVILLSAVRWRWLLRERPALPIYGVYTDLLLFASDVAMLITISVWLMSIITNHHPRGPRSRAGGLATRSAGPWSPRPPAQLHTNAISTPATARAVDRGDQSPALNVGSPTARTALRGWPAPLLLPLLGLGIALVLSTITALDQALALMHSLRLGMLALFSLAVMNTVKDLRDLQLPLSVMLIAHGVIAIGQTFLQRSLGLEALGEHVLDPQWRGVSVVVLDGSRFLRAYGLADHPNLLAGALMAALVLLPSGWPPQRWRQALLLLASALGCLALYVTFSRAAWLGALAGAALLLFCRRSILIGPGPIRMLRRPLYLALALCGLALGIGIASTARVAASRVDTVSTLEQAAGTLEREYLNTVTWNIFMQHPMTGVGLNNLTLAQRAQHPVFPLSYQPAHLVPLTAAAETGLLGGASVLLANLLPLLATWRARASLSPSLLCASAALLAFGVAGLFDFYPWTWATGRIWQWLIYGLWAAAYRAATSIQS